MSYGDHDQPPREVTEEEVRQSAELIAIFYRTLIDNRVPGHAATCITQAFVAEVIGDDEA